MLVQATAEIATTGRGLVDVTNAVAAVVANASRDERIVVGVANVFIHHTSASLIISENADPDVCRDLDAFLQRLVPDGDSLYRHVDEGPDDMPAHIKAALTQTFAADNVPNGSIRLGWQAMNGCWSIPSARCQGLHTRDAGWRRTPLPWYRPP